MVLNKTTSKKTVKNKAVQTKAKKKTAKEVKQKIERTSRGRGVKQSVEKSKLQETRNKKRQEKYIEAVGRRKTSTARVRLLPDLAKKEILINSKKLEEYFAMPNLQNIVLEPLEKLNYSLRFAVTVKVKGGGIHSQAEAVRHGLSRALVKLNPDFRKRLKKLGFLTRDPRMRERKKFGLKRARKAPQWSKR